MTGLLIDGRDGKDAQPHPVDPHVYSIPSLSSVPPTTKPGDILILTTGEVYYVVTGPNPPDEGTYQRITSLAGPKGPTSAGAAVTHYMCSSKGNPAHVQGCPPEFKPRTYRELIEGPTVAIDPLGSP